LLRYATEKLSAIEGVRIVGTAREKASVLSFVIDDIHPMILAPFWINRALPFERAITALSCHAAVQYSGHGARFVCFL